MNVVKLNLNIFESKFKRICYVKKQGSLVARNQDFSGGYLFKNKNVMFASASHQGNTSWLIIGEIKLEALLIFLLWF